MNLANEVEYIATDDKRQVIPYVRLRDRNGRVREYVADGVTSEQLAKGERRRMDCTDCHNRPSHAVAATPERAVNEAMARGEIPAALPFVHREVISAVKATYPSQDAAAERIERQLRDFYRASNQQADGANTQDVEKAVAGAQAVYRRNVFP